MVKLTEVDKQFKNPNDVFPAVVVNDGIANGENVEFCRFHELSVTSLPGEELPGVTYRNHCACATAGKCTALQIDPIILSISDEKNFRSKY